MVVVLGVGGVCEGVEEDGMSLVFQKKILVPVRRIWLEEDSTRTDGSEPKAPSQAEPKSIPAIPHPTLPPMHTPSEG